jgi:cell division protein FtsW
MLCYDIIIGRDIMKSLFNKMDKLLLALTIIMFLFGLLMVFSASSVKAAVIGNPYSIFLKHLITLVICFVVSFFLVAIPTKSYRKYISFAVYAIIGLLVLVFIYGPEINGAERWIELGFFNFQPSEFAKTILIIYMGIYYHKFKESKNISVLYKPLVLGLIICALVFIQPDLGTMSIILGIIGLIFISLPISKDIKKKTIQIAVGGVLIMALLFVLNDAKIFRPGQMARLNYLNPCQRYTESTGYQVCNGFIAINNGGIFGVGLGNSTQKYLYLPAAHTDFIFPIIIEELGLIAGLIIILVYIMILGRIFRITSKCHTLMGSIITYGVFIYILLHVFVNLVGVLGILPLTGAPLPFLSYGGSYTLNLAICLAIVQRIEIENNIYQKEKLLKRRK